MNYTTAQFAAATTPETAIVVADYPYGFRLRCSIRYWLEFRKGHGFRFMSQTTNPKKPGHPWNKPKASTYADVTAAIYQDPTTGHIEWAVLSRYAELKEFAPFLDTYEHNMTAEARRSYDYHRKIAQACEDAKAKHGISNMLEATRDECRAVRASAIAAFREANTQVHIDVLDAMREAIVDGTDPDGDDIPGECAEVAATMHGAWLKHAADIRTPTYDDAFDFVTLRMPEESHTVICNIAQSLWRANKAEPRTIWNDDGTNGPVLICAP